MTDSVVTAFAYSLPDNPYQWEQCRVFVKSLRRFYSRDLVIWGHDFDAETLKQFKKYDVIVRDPGKIPENLWINSARFFVYADMTKNEDWEKYFLFDVRDIVFQANPMDHYAGGLHVFAEDQTIGENAINAAWIQAYWGNIGLVHLLDKPVLCAGTIMGDRKNILAYCNAQRYFSSILPDINDQGVHNWVVHTNSLKNVVQHGNSKSMVWTVGTKEGTDWYRLAGPVIQTPDRFTPCIVHQFDRHSELLAAVEAEYAD